jgi:hypothetical protein
MKIPALIAVAALACGSAFAAQPYSSGSRDADTEAGRSHSTAVSKDMHAADKQASKPNGVVAKTKNAMHRMGDKMRNAGHRVAAKGQPKSTVRDDEKSYSDPQGADTRAMGAAGSDRVDRARQARMDEAYSHWQSKQK